MTRIKRRIAGMFRKRKQELQLAEVKDPRKAQGKRWKSLTLLTATLAAMMAGAKSLSDVEDLTTSLSRELRCMLGIPRRIPDTTLRTFLCKLDPLVLRAPLIRAVRAAHRRRALTHDSLPFGVASMDGKATALPSADDHYAQRQTQDAESGPLTGVVRTISTVLTSSPARPFIDVFPVPAATNEMGVFERALRSLVQAYEGLDLFRLVTYDAGACSEKNADVVRELGLHYLFGLRGTQPTLLHEAKRLLAERAEPDAVTEDVARGQVVTRRVFLQSVEGGFDGWKHLRTFVCVTSETRQKDGTVVAKDERYYLSSLPKNRLTSDQWLRVARMHWGVETAHQVLDVAFDEDDHRWIESDPRGNAVAVVLRRIAYTLLSLYRSVTLRSDQNRQLPWSDLLGHVARTFRSETPLGLFPAPA